MICSIGGCDSKAAGRGWCHKHYKRWQTHGDPECVKNNRIHGMTLKERILDTVVKENGCWIWLGSVSKKTGRPRLKYKCKTTSAHRVAFIAFNGEIPKGLMVLHKCDNKMCVNPDHLYAGTHKDNMWDRRVRGIAGKRALHHKAKLTEESIRFIRNYSDLTATELASKLGVCISTVCRVRNMATWKEPINNANQRKGNI